MKQEIEILEIIEHTFSVWVAYIRDGIEGHDILDFSDIRGYMKLTLPMNASGKIVNEDQEGNPTGTIDTDSYYRENKYSIIKQILNLR